MPEVCAVVFAFITAARLEEAVVTSVCVARDPVERPAPVSVRVVEIHTSEASVPKEESVRVVEFQTLVGMDTASEVDAASTAALVLLFTLEVTPAV